MEDKKNELDKEGKDMISMVAKLLGGINQKILKDFELTDDNLHQYYILNFSTLMSKKIECDENNMEIMQILHDKQENETHTEEDVELIKSYMSLIDQEILLQKEILERL